MGFLILFLRTQSLQLKVMPIILRVKGKGQCALFLSSFQVGGSPENINLSTTKRDARPFNAAMFK
jgi:hypothetical protein